MSQIKKEGYVKTPVNLHNDPYVDQLNSLFEALHGHDDRSLILTISAFAEDTLELLLLNYLREPKQAKELVNGFNAPLGTFSSRIKAAFVLGLMQEDDYKTLQLLRKIRNKFAHNWDGVSLDREDIASLVNEFSLSFKQKYTTDEEHTQELSARERIVEKSSDVLINLRMLAKELDRNSIKAPLLAGERTPVKVNFVEVDEFTD